MSLSDKEKVTRERLRELRKRAEDLGLREDEIKALFCQDPSSTGYKTFTRILKSKILLRNLLERLASHFNSLFSIKYTFAFLILVIGYSLSSSANWNLRDMLKTLHRTPCCLKMPAYVAEIIRPQVPCGMCRDLKTFPVVHNISREEFANSYAYTGVPVLVKGAMEDWPALHSFNYQYFKRLYQSSRKSLKHLERECSFFPYQTEFETLADVFKMSDDRAALKNGTRPWYIGWSNCLVNSNDVGKVLREQYSLPSFLPSHSSNIDTDWIFMGGPGFGSGMHIDFVLRPSWQAQISGSKTWLLEPSPECWHQCQRLEITVEKGDIIVVDTNIWYHSTRVNPGNISITIGAEYD